MTATTTLTATQTISTVNTTVRQQFTRSTTVCYTSSVSSVIPATTVSSITLPTQGVLILLSCVCIYIYCYVNLNPIILCGINRFVDP